MYHTLFCILVAMIIMHVIADFILQGKLGDLKQKEYWKELVPDLENTIYRNDYKIAMFVHSLVWTLLVMSPIIYVTHYIYKSDDTILLLCVFIVINTYLHYEIDDYKANKKILNLIADQSLHFTQIASTFTVFACLYLYGI